MAQKTAEHPPIGRTALGGAACGFTYDAALQDTVAREERLRRPLRLARWQDGRRAPAPSVDHGRELAEAEARPDLSS